MRQTSSDGMFSLPNQAATLEVYLDYLLNKELHACPQYELFLRLNSADHPLSEKWDKLVQLAGVSYVTRRIGGAEMNQAEIAIFTVYCIVFNVTETLLVILENPTYLSTSMRILVRYACGIRQWAQSLKQKDEYLDISYSELSNHAIEVCTLLLHSNYQEFFNQMSLNLEIAKVANDIIHSHNVPAINPNSKWNRIRRLLKTITTFKSLSRKQEKKGESFIESAFKKVNTHIIELFSTDINDLHIDVIKQHRIKAVSRAVGLTNIALLLQKSQSSTTCVVKHFISSLVQNKEKQHYWHQIKSADPYLLCVVQRAFYRVYNRLQNSILHVQNSSADPEYFQQTSCIIQALCFPFQPEDSLMLLNCRIQQTISQLLLLSRGHLNNDQKFLGFNKSQCITSLQFVSEEKVNYRVPFAEVGLPGYERLFVQYIKGEPLKNPIVELIFAKKQLKGWEVASRFKYQGAPAFLLIKREQPQISSKYLTHLNTRLECNFTEFVDLQNDFTIQTSEKLKEIKELSWSLIKYLLLNLLSSNDTISQSKSQQLLQKLIYDVFKEMITWRRNFQRPSIIMDSINDVASGEVWLKDEVRTVETSKNPVQEWLRILCYGDGESIHAIQDYICYIDPYMHGVVSIDHLQNVPEEYKSNFNYELALNQQGQLDFFCFINNNLLNHHENLTDQELDMLTTCELLYCLPLTFEQATKQFDFTDFPQIMRNIYANLPPGSQIQSLLDQFSMGEYSTIPNKLDGVPSEFYNAQDHLDMYCILANIQRRPRQFEKYHQELQKVFKLYPEFPISALELFDPQHYHPKYVAPILLNITLTINNQSIQDTISRNIDSILHHMFYMTTFTAKLLAFKIAQTVIPSYHSPESLQTVWERLDFDKFYFPVSQQGKSSFTNSLIAILGLREIYSTTDLHLEESNQWHYEAMKLFKLLIEQPRWRKYIQQSFTQILNESSFASDLSALNDIVIGLFQLLQNLQNDSYESIAFGLCLVRVQLTRSIYQEAFVIQLDKTQVHLYSPGDDTWFTESYENVSRILLDRTLNLLDDSFQATGDNALQQSLIQILQNLNTQQTYQTDPILKYLLIKNFSLSLCELISKSSSNIHSLLDISQLIIFPLLNQTSINYDFTLRHLTKNRIIELLNSKSRRRLVSQKYEKDSNINARLQELDEYQQIFVAEIVTLGFTTGEVLTAYDKGLKTHDQMLNWLQKTPSSEPVPVFELTSNMSKHGFFSYFDGKVAVQDKNGVIWLKGPGSIKYEIGNFCLSLVQQPVEEITFLVQMDATDPAVFGISLGSLCIQAISNNGNVTISVKENVIGMFDYNELVKITIKVVANINGSIQIYLPFSQDPYNTFMPDVFLGGAICDFEFWLKEGTISKLCGLDIYNGRYINQKHHFTIQHTENFPQINLSPHNPCNKGLQLLALTQSQIQVSNVEKIEDAYSQIAMQEPTNEESELQAIRLIQVFDDIQQVPQHYTIITKFDGSFIENMFKIVAYTTQYGEGYIQYISFEKDKESPTSFGQITREKAILPSFDTLYGKISNKPSICDLKWIEFTNLTEICLPSSYKLVRNSQNLVVELPIFDSANTKLALAFRTIEIFPGAHLKSNFSLDFKLNSQYSLFQGKRPFLRNKTLHELIEIYSIQCSGKLANIIGTSLHRIMTEDKSQFVEFLRQYPAKLWSLAFDNDIKVNELIDVIVINGDEDLASKLAKHVSLILHCNIVYKSDKIFSSHDPEIVRTIDWQIDFAISVMSCISQMKTIPDILQIMQRSSIILPLFIIAGSKGHQHIRKAAFDCFCKLLRGQHIAYLPRIIEKLEQQVTQVKNFEQAIKSAVFNVFVDIIMLYWIDTKNQQVFELIQLVKQIRAFADKSVGLARIILQSLGYEFVSNDIQLVIQTEVDSLMQHIPQIYHGVTSMTIEQLQLSSYRMSVLVNDQVVKGEPIKSPEIPFAPMDIMNLPMNIQKLNKTFTQSMEIRLGQIEYNSPGFASLDIPLINKAIYLKLKVVTIYRKEKLFISIGSKNLKQYCAVFRSNGSLLLDNHIIVNDPEKATKKGSIIILKYNSFTRLFEFYQDDILIGADNLNMPQEQVSITIGIAGSSILLHLQEFLVQELPQGYIERHKYSITSDTVIMNYPDPPVFIHQNVWVPYNTNLKIGQDQQYVISGDEGPFVCGLHPSFILSSSISSFEVIDCEGPFVIDIGVIEKGSIQRLFDIEVKRGTQVALLLDYREQVLLVYKNKEQIMQIQIEIIIGKSFVLTFQEPNVNLSIISPERMANNFPFPQISNTIKNISMPIEIRAYHPLQSKKDLDSLQNLLSKFPNNTLDRFQKLYKNLSSGIGIQFIQFINDCTLYYGKTIEQVQQTQYLENERLLMQYKKIQNMSRQEADDLFSSLLTFNNSIKNNLTNLNLSIQPGQTPTVSQQMILHSRELIFFSEKLKIITPMLKMDSSGQQLGLEISRSKAFNYWQKGLVDIKGEFSIFGQVYRQVKRSNRKCLKQTDRIFSVRFLGEGSIDAGGPYRELWSNICEELQSSLLRLLIKTPNQVANAGSYREAWMVNPQANTVDDLKLFKFLGVILGVAIRTDMTLDLQLAPIFWKRLVNDRINVKDLKKFDFNCYKVLQVLRNLKGNSITPENFEYAFDETFTTRDSSGQIIALQPNGHLIPVNYDNADQYADLIEEFRLNESKAQYEKIWQGMGKVIPVHLLNIFTYKEIELLVCGPADFNVEFLKQHTSYSISKDSLRCRLLWDILEEFTPKEKSLFLKFVWGRSRLPLNMTQKMKITSCHVNGDPNNYMPITHTCFFTIDLPDYTDFGKFKDKLLYAIHNCKAIDNDGGPTGEWDNTQVRFQYQLFCVSLFYYYLII